MYEAPCSLWGCARPMWERYHEFRICEKDTTNSEFLFGENLVESMKHAKETSKMSKSSVKDNSSSARLNKRPYSRKQGLNILMITVILVALLCLLKLLGQQEKAPKTVNQQISHEDISQILEDWSNSVSLFLKYLTCFKGCLHESDECNRDCSASYISQCLSAWESLTSDQEVL